MLLDDERYANVIEYGKDAVTKINEGNLKEGFEIADKGLHIYTYSVIGFSIFMISQGVFIALGRTKVPLVMSILRIWLLRYIFILVTQKYLGLYSIFWGNLFSNTLAGIIFFILVKIINSKKGTKNLH